MKILILNLITFLFITPLFAQQTAKPDDALLMEYYQSQQYAKAVIYLKATFPEPVTDQKILTRLAYASQMANKLVEAENYYQRAYELDTTKQNLLFNMAGINMRRGNLTRAAAYYKHILLTDTTNFAVYGQLALISENQNDTLNTIQYLQRANQLNTADVDVASSLADVFTTLKQFAKALLILKNAAEKDPDNIIILISTAKLTYAEKKWAPTVEVCEKLNRMHAAHGDIITKLGIAYYNLNNFACGAETFAGLDGLEQTEYTFYYAALCYKGLKDQASSIAFMNRAIEQGISPNIASYYGEIADSEQKLRKYKKAANAYTKGLQFNENPTIYYLLANLYDTKLKDKINAVKFYKKYLASRPPAKQQSYIVFTKSRVEQIKRSGL